MAIPYEEVLARESQEMQTWVEQRAAELIAEEMSLRELRRLRKLTQARLAKKLKIGQEGVSRIEKRTDLYLSTLRGYVEAMGGKLTLMVEFPDRQPVILVGLGEDANQKSSEKKAKKKSKTKPQTKAGARRAA
jgi:transcriptional regulator with XRE-family HTH domain